MFKTLKALWQKPAEGPLPQDNDASARALTEKIALLETQLEKEPGNSEVQKELMLIYNRALSVYAGSKSYRQRIDTLFLRMDELRSLIRRSV